MKTSFNFRPLQLPPQTPFTPTEETDRPIPTSTSLQDFVPAETPAASANSQDSGRISRTTPITNRRVLLSTPGSTQASPNKPTPSDVGSPVIDVASPTTRVYPQPRTLSPRAEAEISAITRKVFDPTEQRSKL